MKHLFSLLFILIGIASFAQYSYPEPQINPKDPALPEWVKEMYSDNPDVYKVDKLRDQYFDELGRKHDIYTRWYKRWRRYVAPYVTDDGRISIPTTNQRLEESTTINRSSSREAGTWT